MSSNRDNCIILLIEPPVTERLDPEFISAFGVERALHLHLDLLQNAYKLAKNFKDAILILSFDKSSRHPDLTWLDSEDPGFLEAKGKNPQDRILEAFQLAFNTGAKKALLLSHLSPDIKPEWLYQTFDSVSDKTVALGLNQNGAAYLVGLTLNNLKVLEGFSLVSPKTAEEIAEKAKKNKLTVFSLPESYAVKNEETLRKWMDSRDSSPSLFKSSSGAGAPPQDERKHVRRGHKHTASPSSLPDVDQKPLQP